MRTVILHPDMREVAARHAAEYALAEARNLTEALPGLEVIGAEIVPLRQAHPGTLFGSGKVDELGARLRDDGATMVVIDGPVTPVQQRNLERRWKVRILDRTGLILEIFADRAHTREGVLQVEIAALAYQRSRLVRAWTHLERQRGGFGFVGGPGETQMEADRRMIDDQTVRLRRQLARIVRTRDLQRAARERVPFPVIALVGYTNAGKSSLFNRLTGAGVVVRDMLFATLDPTMRGLVLPGGQKVILSDTVGFISALPTELVAAFRATLEEVLSADLIVHVRDISHPETAAQAADVNEILASLGVDAAIPVIEAWNKIDRVGGAAREALRLQAVARDDVFPVSATTGEGVAALVAALDDVLGRDRRTERLHLGYDRGAARAALHDLGVVQDESTHDDGWTIKVAWTGRQRDGWRAAWRPEDGGGG